MGEAVARGEALVRGAAAGHGRAGSFFEAVARVARACPRHRREEFRARVVTIMFTDLVGSSALAERLGDRALTRLLAAHQRDVKAEIRRHGGRLVKSQGDGFMAVFPSVTGALRCALEISELSERNGGPGVRVGIHSGEALTDGKDYFGRSVIVAARLVGLAGRGEVLVSSAVRDLTPPGTGVTFADAIECELKGLSGLHVALRAMRPRGQDRPGETREIA